MSEKKVSKKDEKILSTIEELTPEENAKYEVWVKNRSSTAKLEWSTDGDSVGHIGSNDAVRANYKLIDTMGASDLEAAELLLKQVGNLTMRGGEEKPDLKAINELLSLVGGFNPTDNVEGMLAAQMVAVHTMVMDCSQRAMLKSQTFDGKNMNLNQAVKLMRTYTTQMESLNKYRGKGQQKMTVEHVHVNEGGQAIIGNVEGG
ncbi:MAG: hypothetical protein ACJATK_000689 [Paracoccaceae bacterium]|jgi:hypothetical protein